MNMPTQTVPAMQEPTLADMLRLAGQGRRAILTGGAIGFLAGAAFMMLAIPQYRASMLVAPVTRTGTSDLAGPLPDNASFATEYMLKSFSAGNDSDFAWFEHVMREPSVAKKLLNDPLIRNGVAQDRAFRFQWRHMPEKPEELSVYLNDHIGVEPVGATSMRRITFDHADRDFARAMLETITSVTDGMIRDDMRVKADKRIAWLQQAVQQTQNPDDRRALTGLMIEQQQIRMMLDLNEPYAARVAEPASVGVKPVWPRKVLVLPLFTLVGLVLGFAVFGVRRALRQPGSSSLSPPGRGLG